MHSNIFEENYYNNRLVEAILEEKNEERQQIRLHQKINKRRNTKGRGNYVISNVASLTNLVF